MPPAGRRGGVKVLTRMSIVTVKDLLDFDLSTIHGCLGYDVVRAKSNRGCPTWSSWHW